MYVLTAVWIGIISILMWMPLPGGGVNPLGNLDLVIHFGLFLILGYLLFHTIKPERNRFYWIDWLSILFVVAIVAESGQFFLDTRSVGGMDYFINVLGGLAGGALCLQPDRRAQWIKSPLLGLPALLIGFSGTLWGNWVFDHLIVFSEITVPVPIISTLVILTLGVLILAFLNRDGTWGRIDSLEILFVLAMVGYSFAHGLTATLVVTVTASFIIASKNYSIIRSVDGVLWLVFLGAISTVYVSPQDLFDQFGVIYIVLNCLVVIESLLNQLLVEDVSPGSTINRSTARGQEY